MTEPRGSGQEDPEAWKPLGIRADISLFSLPLSIGFLGLAAFLSAAKGASAPAAFAAVAFALMASVRAWGFLSLVGVSASIRCGQTRLFPGERLEIRADISNRKILPVWIRLELAYSGALEPEGPDGSRREESLLPFGRSSSSWSFRPVRRGVYSLGPALLTAGDVLGLYSREKNVPYSHGLVVFPHPAELEDFDIPFRDTFGIHPSKGIIEDPAWYEGTREYQGHKPLRNIHWKASARLDSLQEKIFAPTSHQKIFLILDGAGFAEIEALDELEASLEILAGLAVRFSEAGASFAFATDLAVKDFPAVAPLGRGPEHLGLVLEVLARCGSQRGQSLGPLVSGAGAAGAGFVVVSRMPTLERTQAFLALPSSRRSRAFVLFARRADEEFPQEYPFAYFDDIRKRDGQP